MTRDKLTLWEAMEHVLENATHPMSPMDIASEIEKQNLYWKRDGRFADAWQILMRANHKSEQFEVAISLRKRNK